MASYEYNGFFDKINALKELLNDNNICSLITALRGNDFDLSTIKYVFTARIRYFLTDGSYLGVVRESKYLNYNQIDSYIDDIKKLSQEYYSLHYFHHINEAIHVLHWYEMIDEWEFNVLHELLLVTTSYLISKEDKDASIITVRNALNKLLVPIGDVK